MQLPHRHVRRALCNFSMGPTRKLQTALSFLPLGVLMAGNCFQTLVAATPRSTHDIFRRSFSRYMAFKGRKNVPERIANLATPKQAYEVLTDAYSNVQRLNLFAFDGTPLNPMYLAYKPPQMLPTQTLNPTSTGANGAKSTGATKAKRSAHSHENIETPLSGTAKVHRKQSMRADMLWWFGVGITAIGGVGYVCF